MKIHIKKRLWHQVTQFRIACLSILSLFICVIGQEALCYYNEDITLG